MNCNKKHITHTNINILKTTKNKVEKNTNNIEIEQTFKRQKKILKPVCHKKKGQTHTKTNAKRNALPLVLSANQHDLENDI